jgi:hypothetical protein
VKKDEGNFAVCAEALFFIDAEIQSSALRVLIAIGHGKQEGQKIRRYRCIPN